MINHAGPVIASHNGLSVINCAVCGYAHLKCLPTQRELDTYYGAADSEYNTAAGWLWLENERLEHHYRLWQPAYRHQAGLLKRGRLLDVGAGAGWFVEWWRKHIYPVALGIEPSETARKAAVVNLFAGLDDLKNNCIADNITFNNLRFSLVLEHVLNPRQFLETYLPKLESGGRVMVIVPHEFNPLQQKLIPELGHWYVDKRHVNYFNAASLKMLFERVGLRVIHTGVTHPTELWRLAGLNNDKEGWRWHKGRLLLEKLAGPGIFKLYTWLYRRYGWGRELIMVGVKN